MTGRPDKLGKRRGFVPDDRPEDGAPRPPEQFVFKNKPCCFVATPLVAFLRDDGVDTLVIVGTSTSGCVRAGAIDAFSHDVRPVLVEQACGDRCPAAHRADPCDLDMKFARVERLGQVEAEPETRFGAASRRAAA